MVYFCASWSLQPTHTRELHRVFLIDVKEVLFTAIYAHARVASYFEADVLKVMQTATYAHMRVASNT